MISDMNDFDIILGMTWLFSFYYVLSFNTLFVTIEIPRREKLELEVVYKLTKTKIISSIRYSKLVE